MSQTNKEEKEKNIYPEDLDINLKATDPIGELEKIDNYYKEKEQAITEPSQEKNNNGLEMSLQELEMPTYNKDEVESKVKSSLDDKYAGLKQKQEDLYLTSVINNNKNKDSFKAAAKETENKINAIYDETSLTTQNQALKRGLARSSIILNQLNQIEGSRAGELSKVATNLLNEINSLDNEVAQLANKKEKALKTLDINYVTDLQEQIQNKYKEYEAKKAEVIEFNNKVKEKQAEYNLNKDKQDRTLALEEQEAEQKYGKPEEQTTSKYDDATQVKVQYILTYLNSLSRINALKKLTSDSMFAYYLGDAWQDVYYMQVARPINS